MFRKFKINFIVIVPLLIGIVLSGISIWTIFYYLTVPATEIRGSIDVLYDCERNDSTSAILELEPLWETQDVYVLLIIPEWKKFIGNSDVIQINFSGVTDFPRHVIQRAYVFPELPIGITSNDLGGNLADISKPLLPSEMEISQNSWGKGKTIKIYPKKIDNFTGAIEFFWKDAIKKSSFTDLDIYMSFNSSPIWPNDQLYRIRNYTIKLFTPKDYNLVSSKPQFSKFNYGYGSNYQFDIDIYKTDLVTTFENKKLLKMRDYSLIIFSTLLGIGLALIVEEVIGLIKIKATLQ